MYKLQIIVDGVKLDSYTAESVELLRQDQSYINRVQAKVWGEPAHTKTVEVSPDVYSEDGELLQEAVLETVEVPNAWEEEVTCIDKEIQLSEILKQITHVESKQTDRVIRDALLGNSTKLQEIEDEIAELRIEYNRIKESN